MLGLVGVCLLKRFLVSELLRFMYWFTVLKFEIMRHNWHVQDVAINFWVNDGWWNLFLLKLVARFNLFFLDCLSHRRLLCCFGLLCQTFEDLFNRFYVDRDRKGHPARYHLVNRHFCWFDSLDLLFNNVLYFTLDVIHLLILWYLCQLAVLVDTLSALE